MKAILNYSFLTSFILLINCANAQSVGQLLIPSENFQLQDWEQLKAQESFSKVDYHEVYARPKGKSPILKFVRIESSSININEFISENLFKSSELDAVGELASCSYPDAGWSLQWGLENTGTRNGSVAGADISACEAWDISTGDSSITVGFVDSGNRSDHIDLTGRVWTNPGEIPGNNIDDDNNGFIDDVHGWNTWLDNADITDNIGHGTQINGIVGSNPNNGTGFVGLDHACQLINVKGVNDQGQGLNSWWAEGVYYLVDNGADIINMSLTSYFQVQVVQDALQYAEDNGVLVVAAVGNDRREVGYPAAYPTVFAVGATDHADIRATWSGVFGSNFGTEIDVVAPGKAIYGINHLNNTTQYVTAGTSQAAPLAAGLAALMLATDSSLTVDSLKAVIRRTAEDEVGLSSEDTPGFDNYHGYGRINAFEALKAVMPDTTTQDTSTQDTGSTGIGFLAEQQVSIYPNPSHSFISITGLPEGNYNLTWLSLNGAVHLNQRFVSENHTFNTPSSPGVYILHISSDNGESIRKKVVVKP